MEILNNIPLYNIAMLEIIYSWRNTVCKKYVMDSLHVIYSLSCLLESDFKHFINLLFIQKSMKFMSAALGSKFTKTQVITY